MATTPTECVFKTVDLTKWDNFVAYIAGISDATGDHHHPYVWRGQRRKDWKLEASLHRPLNPVDPGRTRFLVETFKSATRGMQSMAAASTLDEYDWWALGRQYGLRTPLLDWTASPYVAAFFAFDQEEPISPDANRAVWGLHLSHVWNADELVKNKGIKCPVDGTEDDVVEFIRPLSSDRRFLGQQGLYTRTASGEDLKVWVERREEQGHFVERRVPVLLKLLIPGAQRDNFLRNLNLMNINHLTLFPDLFGAAHYSNLALDVDGYLPIGEQHWRKPGS